MAQYFYDQQIKRFLLQFARIFSNWHCSAGYDQRGNLIVKRVPIMYGDSSRMAAVIVAQNSASSLPTTPLITYYITGIEFDQSRTQEPYFIDNLDVRQRAFNPETGDYETTQGNAFSVRRLMPVPYKLSMKLDIWTSNYNQKLEIFEQLSVLFNPSMEIQSTDNFVDWTSLTVLYQNGINWSSRSIPMGTSNPIDILSWDFYLPIWLSSPIQVTKYNVIQRIIASIFKGSYRDDIEDEDLLLGTRQKITPYGYQLLYMGNQLQILPQPEPKNPPNSSLVFPDPPPDTDLQWQAVLLSYGQVRPGISMIALENPYWETEIMGTITFNPTDDRLLVFNVDVDTLPQNTLPAVNGIIDPLQKYPGEGLPLAAPGQRYLIVSDIPQQGTYSIDPPPPAVIQTSAWQGLTQGARANDIIEYDASGVWYVSFNSTELQSQVQFVTNLNTNVQYRFLNDEGWMKSVEGYYDQGSWRVVI